MFSVDYIFLLNITYVFAIITCLGFLVLINSLEYFFNIKGHVALDLGLGYDTLLLRLIPGDFLTVYIHINISPHYPAYYTVRPRCQMLTIMPAFQAGRQSVPFYNIWSLV